MNPPPIPVITTDKEPVSPAVTVQGTYADRVAQGRVSVMSGVTRAEEIRERKPLCNGTVVGQYLITSLMGRGGFGLTYAAICRRDNRQVVLKEHMPVGITIRDTDGVFVTTPTQETEETFQATLDEFLDEINIIMSLEHPGIVRILDAFEANGTAYYVMPLVQGSHMEITKRAEVDRSLRTREARRIRQQLTSILNALVYLGQNQVVHRDLKPENILITPEGHPILLDFGSARQIRSDKEYPNVFTPAFCAPEQVASGHDPVLGKMKIGSWTDLYSLGVCFHYRITRMLPPSAETRMFSYPDDPYRQLSRREVLKELYGERFLKGLDRALSLEVDKRWQKAQDWLDYLEKGSRTERPWKWRNLIPYAAAVGFAAVGCGLLCRNIALRKECYRLYESSVTFESNLLEDFYSDMVDLPGSSSTQEKFCRYLSDLMQRTEEFSTSYGLEYRENAALVHLNVGKYHKQLGALSSALENLTLAENDILFLSEKEPDDYQYQCTLAIIRTQKADVLHALGKDSEASKEAASAVGIMHGLCRNVPKSPDYVGTLCEALLSDANIKYDNGNAEEAMTALAESFERLEANLTSFPRHRGSLKRKAESLHLKGRIALDSGDPETAEQYFEQEITIYSRLLENNRFSLSYSEGSVNAMFYKGYTYTHRVEADPDNAEFCYKAEKFYTDHIEKCQELERLDAERPSFLYVECNSLAAIQSLLLQKKQNSLSEAYASKLLRKAKLLVQLSPEHVDHTRMLAMAWTAMAAVHSRSELTVSLANKELAEARGIMKRLQELDPDNKRVLSTQVQVLRESAYAARKNGNSADASSYLQQAHTLIEGLCKTYPGNAVYKRMLRNVELLPE